MRVMHRRFPTAAENPWAVARIGVGIAFGRHEERYGVRAKLIEE